MTSNSLCSFLDRQGRNINLNPRDLNSGVVYTPVSPLPLPLQVINLLPSCNQIAPSPSLYAKRLIRVITAIESIALLYFWALGINSAKPDSKGNQC